MNLCAHCHQCDKRFVLGSPPDSAHAQTCLECKLPYWRDFTTEPKPVAGIRLETWQAHKSFRRPGRAA